MTAVLYILTCITTCFCAVLLLRAYGNVRKKLLLWSGLCFVGLTISNIMIIIDLLFLPDTDLYTYRLGSAAVSMVFILYGLIWEGQ